MVPHRRRAWYDGSLVRWLLPPKDGSDPTSTEPPTTTRGVAPGTPNSAARTAPPSQLRVDYKRMNTFFADYTKNISKGGTFIRTSKPLDVGTEFVFVLSIPAARRAARS